MRRSYLAFLSCFVAGYFGAAAAHAQVPIEYAPPATTSVLPPNPHAQEPGLLFYLSGDNGFNADYAAGGNPVPNYRRDVKIVPNGVSGSYIQCGNNQLLSYWAPGNINAQRGTLSFFWRAIRWTRRSSLFSALDSRITRAGTSCGCASIGTATVLMRL